MKLPPILIRFLLAITTGVPFLPRVSPPPPPPPHSLTRLRQNILQNAHNKPSTAKQGRYFSPNKSQMNYGAFEFLMNVQHKILIRISSYLFLGVVLLSTFDSNEISPLETDPNMTESVNDKPLLHKTDPLILEENQRKTWKTSALSSLPGHLVFYCLR